ncbi:MAG: 4Fe-4S dicluster domain-containing protein [Oscillospiraceae bacterium]
MRKANIETKYCVACGSCMKACPKGAIEIYRGIYALVNGDMCVGCGKCMHACPASTIIMEDKNEE